MTKVKVKHPYVTQKEGVQGGSPIIRGTRIPISSVIIQYQRGKDVDEILEIYPHLTPAQVYDALSYYHDHQKQMDKEIALLKDEAHWKRKYPPGKGKTDTPNESIPN